jgi:serine/threonine protein kinase
LFRRKKHHAFDPFADAGFVEATIIGSGATSTVYRAREVAFNRPVAVKLFNVPPTDDTAKRRLERELHIAGALGAHPNIVTLFRTGFLVDGRAFVAMELCSEGSLPTPSDPYVAISAAIKVAGALQTAHDLGVVHRDVKPQNILIRKSGDAVLSDFGVAIVQDDASVTTEAMTPAHAAAEVLSGGAATYASDQWSLASSLYQALRGISPFPKSEGEGPLAWRIRAIEEPLPRFIRAGIPPGVFDVIERAMQKDPASRWPSMTAFAEALQAVEVAASLQPTAFAVLDLSDVETSHPSPPVAAVRDIEREESGTVSRDISAAAVPVAPIAPAQVGSAVEPDDSDGGTVMRDRQAVIPATGSVDSPPASPGASRRVPLLILAALAVAGAVAVGVLSLQQDDGTAPNATVTTTASTDTPLPPGDPIVVVEPELVSIASDTGDSVTLRWTDRNAGELPYVIDVTESGVSVMPVVRADRADGTTIGLLTPGRPYCFSVGTVFAIGEPPAYAAPVCRTF